MWTQRGVKRPVWRCVSRLDYGKKFCTQSPTLDEEPLQQAILAAVNAVMLDRDTLARQLTAVMEWELAPMLGESMSLADIDRALEELSSQFNSLLAEASANPAEDYTERFRELSESTTRLKERKAQLEGACQEQGRLQNRLRAVSAAMEHMTAAMTEWDEEVIHQLLEKVTVLSREKIRVTFRDGRKIEQYVAQPKRRKLARRFSLQAIPTGILSGFVRNTSRRAKSSPRKMWYSSWETSAACGSGINGMTRPWTPCCKPNCRRRNCTLRLAGPSVLARRRARR